MTLMFKTNFYKITFLQPDKRREQEYPNPSFWTEDVFRKYLDWMDLIDENDPIPTKGRGTIAMEVGYWAQSDDITWEKVW